MAEGKTAFDWEGNEEDIGIPDTRLGIPLTAKILYDAAAWSSDGDMERNEHPYGYSTLKAWLERMLFAASLASIWVDWDAYPATVNALGASGFFPTENQLHGYTTNRGAVKIRFSNKDFLLWKPETNSNIKVKYEGWDGNPVYRTLFANTNSRPEAVEYNGRFYIFFTDQTDNKVGFYRFRAFPSGSLALGPYYLDAFRANGPVAATVFQGRLYLIFASPTNDVELAWCDSTVPWPPDEWHDFGGGARTKLIWVEDIRPGPSAVAASHVRGLGFTPDLFIAVASQSDGAISVLRVDSQDNLTRIYRTPQDRLRPSGHNHDIGPTGEMATDAPLGITVQESAFPKPMFQGQWIFQNYLYLVWKGKGSSRIYTSVLQNADPNNYHFTIPVETLYDAAADTGVSWTKGMTPMENLQAVFVYHMPDDPSIHGTIWQFNGYGRY
jgi:hypothetical protein